MQLPFMFIHPSKLGWLFTIKAIVTPIVSLGTLIWVSAASDHPSLDSAELPLNFPLKAVKIAGSGVSEALSAPALRAAPGAPRFIAFMYATTSVMGTWATLSCNIGDFSRYCKRPSAAYVQLLAIPLLLGGISIFGAISAACTYAVYGVDLYQPYDMIVSLIGWRFRREAHCRHFFFFILENAV
jgi:nucleobase:cation symporter-1, NCS1 family